MKIQNVSDTSFKKYGKILKGYPTDKILKEMQHTPLPDDVIYVPSVDTLEATSDAKIFQGKGFDWRRAVFSIPQRGSPD